MPGKENDPTNKEGRGREGRKELPSQSHEASQQKAPGEDKRGDLFMANPALRARVSEKQKAPKDSSSQKQVEEKPKSLYLEALSENRIYRATTIMALRENIRLNSENEQLLSENEELVKREDHRKELDKLAQRRRRTKQRLPKDSQHRIGESESTTQTKIDRVKELIEQRHLTNREIANELQIPVGTVADYAAQLVNRGEVSPRKPGRKPKTS